MDSARETLRDLVDQLSATDVDFMIRIAQRFIELSSNEPPF